MCTVPVSTLNRRLTMLFDLGIFPGGSFLIRETTPRPGQAWRRVAEFARCERFAVSVQCRA